MLNAIISKLKRIICIFSKNIIENHHKLIVHERLRMECRFMHNLFEVALMLDVKYYLRVRFMAGQTKTSYFNTYEFINICCKAHWTKYGTCGSKPIA